MSRNKKIFVVDDDSNISGLIALYLNKEGYTTTEFLSGKEMLTKFSGNIPDLVLLDIMLPDMDGYEVLREIRKLSKVPVIILLTKCLD